MSGGSTEKTTSTSTGTSTATTTPNAPATVTQPINSILTAINGLLGMGGVTAPTGGAATSTTFDPAQAFLDSRPDIQQAFSGLSAKDKQYIAQKGYGATAQDYARFIAEQTGTPLPSAPAAPTVGGGGGGGGFDLAQLTALARQLTGTDQPTPDLTEAIDLARKAGATPASTYSPSARIAPQFTQTAVAGDVNPYQPAGQVAAPRYTASGPANVLDAAASGPAGVTDYQAGGPAAVGGYDAAGPAGGRGYDAAGRVLAPGYTAAGPAAVTPYSVAGKVGVNGYTASGPANVADAQAASVLENFNRYMDPYLEGVVNTTLSDFDTNAARARARDAAAAGATGAFSGSRTAVREALTEGESQRGRAAAEAGLRSAAFDKAAGLSTTDAGMRQQTTLANMQKNLTTALDFAGRTDQASRDKMAAEIETALDFARRSDDAGSQEMAARLQSALDYAGRTDAASAAKAEQELRAALDFAGRSDASSQFKAQEQNLSERDFAGRTDAARAFEADVKNRAALDFVGRSDQAKAFAADAANRSAIDFASRTDATTLANLNKNLTTALDLAGRTDEASRAQMQAELQTAMDYVSRVDSAAAQEMQMRLTTALDLAGRTDATSQANAQRELQAAMDMASRADQAAQFNAGQADTAATRQLVSSEQMSRLADQLRGYGQEAAQAPMSVLSQLTALLTGVPLDQVTGKTVTGTETSSGSGTSKTKPGLLDWIGTLGQVAGAM